MVQVSAIGKWNCCVCAGMGLGLVGSLVDSVLGATLQFTGFNRKTGLVTGKVMMQLTCYTMHTCMQQLAFMSREGINNLRHCQQALTGNS